MAFTIVVNGGVYNSTVTGWVYYIGMATVGHGRSRSVMTGYGPLDRPTVLTDRLV